MNITVTIIFNFSKNWRCILKPWGESGQGIQDAHIILRLHFIDKCGKGRKRYFHHGGIWQITPQTKWSNSTSTTTGQLTTTALRPSRTVSLSVEHHLSSLLANSVSPESHQEGTIRNFQIKWYSIKHLAWTLQMTQKTKSLENCLKKSKARLGLDLFFCVLFCFFKQL